MKFAPGSFFALVAMVAVGCGTSPSMRDRAIMAAFPDEYRDYSEGIIAEPTDEDIILAVDFGREFSDSRAVDVAYVYRGGGGFDHGDMYLAVETPLAMVAKYARKQAQEYREPDFEEALEIADLGLVRLNLVDQRMTRGYQVYNLQTDLILLRDGVRVDPFEGEVQFRGNRNPFLRPVLRDAAAVPQQAALDASLDSMRPYVAGMDEAQRKEAARSYLAAGISERRVLDVFGLDKAPLIEETGYLYVSARENVFRVEDLVGRGDYEIRFRTPPSASIFAQGDQERGFEVSFENFR